MWMNGQHCGQSKASSAFPCTGILKMMPPSFQSLHRLLFHYFGNEGLISENLANSTSPLFVSTSVYSRAKFSLSKMKKEETCLLVTPLSILCIHKKCFELFYNQLVRIHTKGYMQKSNRLLGDTLFHIQSAWTAFPHLTPVRKISVALLWHYNKHLAWRISVFPLTDAEGAILERVCVHMCMSVYGRIWTYTKMLFISTLWHTSQQRLLRLLLLCSAHNLL